MNRAANIRPATALNAARQHRWYHQLGLVLLSAGLLSLAFAPVHQFYVAWFALVPWILAVVAASSKKAAFAWGFVGGWLFFLGNMWWLWFVTSPGLFALTLYLAFFWACAAVVIRSLWLALAPVTEEGASRRARPIALVLLVATAWVAFEWLRGNVSFLGRQGLPWLYLGQSQSPLPLVCQVADMTSVLGVSFWLVLLNAALAVLVAQRRSMRDAMMALAPALAVLGFVVAYGVFRMSQRTLRDGPTVLVVQSSYPQSNTGEKGAPLSEIVRFHLEKTRQALQECAAQGKKVDLVVWSETMMPPLNPEARRYLRGTEPGEFWQRTLEQLSQLAATHDTALLVGGMYNGEWSVRDGYHVAADRRNSAYFFDAEGSLSDRRYDKIHLVPFGEYIPFKHSVPPLYRIFIRFGPNYYEEYALTRGTEIPVFELEYGPDAASARFVVPICFEDIVPSMVARMVHDPASGKRADFLVNITNDGWFRGGQLGQHLQAAVFRSIENRAPTARSVNTGISGFVDSLGRVNATIPPGTEGWSAQRLSLDARVALYTRIGDTFPLFCVAVTATALVALTVRGRMRPREGAQG